MHEGEHVSWEACLADGNELQVSIQQGAFRNAWLWRGKAICMKQAGSWHAPLRQKLEPESVWRALCLVTRAIN